MTFLDFQTRSYSVLRLLCSLAALFFVLRAFSVSTRRKHPKQPLMAPKFIKQLRNGNKQTIVAYGTSLTEASAWVADLRNELNRQFPGLANVINSAKSGMYSGWGLENFKERVLDHQPNALLIEFAINDAYVGWNTTVERAKENLVAMLDMAESYRPPSADIDRGIEVILQTMNQPKREALEDRPNIEQYYQMYRDVYRARKLLLVDHEPNWIRLFDRDPRKWWTFVPDGLHPNREGQQKIIVAELFRKLGSVEEEGADDVERVAERGEEMRAIS